MRWAFITSLLGARTVLILLQDSAFSDWGQFKTGSLQMSEKQLKWADVYFRANVQGGHIAVCRDTLE